MIEYGKGESKLGFEQSRQGPDADFDVGFKIRYSPLQNLELTSQNLGDAVGNYVLGARYQIISVLSAGVDVGFPLSELAVWSFTPNLQFSMPLTSALTLGSNFDLAIYTEAPERNNKYGRGLDFTGGIELDLALSEKSTIWVSFDAATGVTRSNFGGDGKIDDGIPLKRDNRQLTMAPALGYIAGLGNLDLGTYVSFTIFSEADGETPNISTAVGVEASVKF